MVCSVSVGRPEVRKVVRSWISQLPKLKCAKPAKFSSKLVIFMDSPGMLAGAPFVNCICEEFGCEAYWHASDGDCIDTENFQIVSIIGKSADVLLCEGLILSVLRRACAIASYTRRLKMTLSDASWKGELRVPHSLTPGFELVEEYSMVIGGASSVTGCVISQWQACAFGGIDKAIAANRSFVGSASKIEVLCGDLGEALSAASSGADIIIFKDIPRDDLKLVSELKKDHPRVGVHLTGHFDEKTITSYCVSSVDLISVCGTVSDCMFSDIRGVYADAVDSVPGEVLSQVNTSAQSSPPRSSQTKISEISEQLLGSTASAPKKLRLDGKAPESPTTTVKPNGPTVRNSNAPYTTPQSKASRDTNLKRPQQNLRSQITTPQRPNTQRSHPPGGMQLLQMTSPRFSSPTGLSPLSQSGPTQSSSNQAGVLGSQTFPPFGLRIPGQPFPQRLGQSMNPGMLGNGPSVSATLLNIPRQSHQPWQALTGGPAMAGVGFGMRMGGPVCRGCGSSNPLGIPFCRSCRTPTR